MRYTFFDPDHPPHGLGAVLRWALWDRLTGRRRVAPPGPPAPWVDADLELIHRRGGGDRITWIGHASALATLGGRHVLIDPVFSRRIGLFYPRHGEPGLAAAQLPALAALLISHSHYDHLDAASLRPLPRDVPAVVPLGLGRWLRRRGFRRVHELGWWDAVRLGELLVTLVPARHWSRRTPWDVNRSLWGGFVVEHRDVAVYHAGDSAFFGGFAEIGRRFPGLAAALLPIGAYAPGWFMEHAHMTPEQAGQAFLDLGAGALLPIHWGAFQLTDEPITEPISRLRAWWERSPPPGRLLVPAVGETVALGPAAARFR